MNITDLPATVVDQAQLTDKVTDPQVGQLVVAPVRNRYRVARVVKVGPKRVTVECTTPTAIEQAWKIAGINREAEAVRNAEHARKQAARYEAEAEVTERLGLATDHLDGDKRWVRWAELPAEYRAVSGHPGNGSGTTIVYGAEQMRAWAADSRAAVTRYKGRIEEARAYDARPLADKAADHVQMTTKNVSREVVWAVPASL